MNNPRLASLIKNPVWENSILKAIERSVANLSKMSGSEWKISSPRISWSVLGKLAKNYSPGEDTGACIHFQIQGDIPLTVVILFPPGDVQMVSKCFLGHSYAKLSCLNQVEELALAELGNILVNAFVGALADTIAKLLLPSVPQCLQGARQSILEALQTTLPEENHAVCVMTLNLGCGADKAMCELFCILHSDSIDRLDKILSA